MSRVRRDWTEDDHRALRRLMHAPALTPVDELRLRRLGGRFRRALRSVLRGAGRPSGVAVRVPSWRLPAWRR